MAKSSPVRLLIAERSENRAHELNSLLRDTGLATRMEFCADPASLADCLLGGQVDLLLCHADLAEIDTLLPQLRTANPELPILLLDSENEDGNSLTRGMALGAADVVSAENPDRLLYVVQREMHHVCQYHQLLRTRKALDESERRCQLLLANSSAAIAYVHEGMHIYANEDYLKIFGFNDPDDLLGIPLLDLVDSDAQNEFKAHMKSFRSSSAEISFPFKGRSEQGIRVEGHMTLSAADYEDETCTQVLLKIVSAPAAPAPAEEQPSVAVPGLEVTQSTQIDSLVDAVMPAQSETGVQAQDSLEPDNSRGANGTSARQGVETFMGDLEYLFLEDDTSQDNAVLLLIDLDNYTGLQQTHGILAAEQAFREVGSIIAPQAANYLFASISEHCYALAKRGVQEADADHVAKTIRSEVEESLLNVAEKTVRCTVTIAAAVIEDPASLSDCIDSSFRALLEAREKGKHNTVLWQTGSQKSATNEDGSELTEKQQKTLVLIENAIENHNFMLLFQPIISLRGDNDEHYEVFLRLKDNDGRELAPHDFLQLAKEQKVAGKIDRWVILQSIKMLSTHRAKGNNTRLTINLTSNSLTDEEFLQWLEVAIKAARLPSDAVIFQITEEDATTYLRHAIAFIEGMKSLHCRTSLGRFGLVKDCFETLDHINVDFVKLDGALLSELHDDQVRRDEFTGMIKKLQAKGKLTIVPMVESATVLSALWQAGANYIQGHYLQEPTHEMNYDFTTDD